MTNEGKQGSEQKEGYAGRERQRNELSKRKKINKERMNLHFYCIIKIKGRCSPGRVQLMVLRSSH